MKEESEEIPLKTILQNFLNHVENLEVAREESLSGEGEDQYEKEFQALKAFSEDLKNKDEFSCSEGDSEANRKKNRYKDILPFNYSRVELSEYPGIPGSDYINANYIKGASGSNAYIASQGPLPNTVNDWWRLVVEKEVQVIVMACNEQEGGKHKCEGYWSDEDNPSRQFGKYSVNLLKSREICPDFLVRTMRLSWAGEEGGEEESRTVCQFHYSAWPDHGIPTQVKPLLEMVRLVRDCQASETLPVLVHCSAGCGRTGSICVIDYVWGLLKTGKLSADFSVYSLVQDMRRQRIAMVQTVDQYMLCHRAVRELFLEQLRVIDSHPYENVGRDGRPLVDKDGAANTPEYETIDYSAKPEAGDTERLGPKPRMGVGMLSREKSPSMILTNGEHSENSSDNSLPATLDEFRSAKSTPSGTPKIHEPPNPPQNLTEPAAQRFKKGNLRLLKADDGGWKLEEMEQERRRSMEAGVSKHDFSGDNNNQIKQEPHEAAKPPQGDAGSRKERRKKSSREEKSESSLLRRPSMKKIKAYFDKDKNKENKDRETDTDKEDSLAGSVAHKLAFSNEYASAVAKIPSLETSGGFFHDSLNIPELGGQSKSVPSSLDRKQRYRDQDVSQIRGVEKTSNNNLGKLWPLKKENKQSMNAKSVSSERLQVGDKPALPVKRSKSMKSNSKPVSVIPVLPGGGEPSFIVDHVRNEQDASYDTYPKSKQKSEEIIDLTKKSPDQQVPHSLHHVGSRENLRSAVSLGQPPPKPKRDWSSLNHDYANVKVTPMTPGPEKASFDFPDPGGHSRQGSREETNKSSQFLDQQMAKLMARKTSGQDEVDGAIRRSKSGDNLSRRNSEILDDDTRRILRDCQEYLLGASFEAREDGGLRPEAEGARGRSAHSSPAGSYNKYHQPGPGVMRSSSGNLSLSPSVASSARSSSLRSPEKSFQSPGRNTEQPPENEYSSLQSDLSEASPQSEAGHSSLETSEARIHEYENVPNVTNNYIDGARGKVSAATNVRTRERRNSFRQAVDKVDGNGRPYEQIWFRGEGVEGEQREQVSPRELEQGPMYANTGAGGSNTSLKVEPVNKTQLRKSDSGSLRSQSGSNIRSGSYDNIPGPGLNTTQAIFTLEPNPTAYEIINFQQPGPVRNSSDTRKMSPGVQSGPGHALQSVGLVAEACRDHEQQQRAASQPKRPVLTKQNSGGNIRAPPPPYQAPPGPPGPPYQSPPVPPPYKHGGHYVTPPKHISPTYSATRYQEPGPQVETSTPKRPVSSKMGPPPPYGANITEGVRKMDISSSRPGSTRPVPSLQSTGPEAVTLRTGRGRLSSRDDSELSRRQKSMKRNSSLVATARLSMGDFILSSTGLGLKPDKSIKTVVGGGAPGSVVQGARTAVMVGGGPGPDSAPGVDLDRVAASMSQASDSVSLAGSSSGPGSGARQLRSLAGAITGAAANFKSKLASAVTGAGVARSSPSPPDPARSKVREVPIRLEGGDQGPPPVFNGEKSPHVIPLTVPGAEYGYPHRIEKRPLGPRETPNFQKKQEYL